MSLQLQEFADSIRDISFLREQYQEACSLIEKSGQKEIVVSVIGQFKRGKSSLINALLEDSILPVGILPLTAVITEIRYGEENISEVLFNDGSKRSVAKERLSDFLSEQSNPKNEKKVHRVLIRTHRFPFGENVVLVDTPGVGSLHQHNTDSAYAYIQKSDAVLFLLSYDSPINETERDFLIAVKEYAARFFFAVNKADTVSAADAEEFVRFCSGHIEGLLGIPCRIFSVSAKTGVGLAELADSIRDELYGREDMLLEKSNGLKLASLRKKACEKMEICMSAAQLPKQELSTKLERLDESCRKLELLSESVDFLAKDRSRRLISEIGGILDSLCMQSQEETAAVCDSFLSSQGSLPYREFGPRIEERINVFVREKLDEMNCLGMEHLDLGYRRIMDDLNARVQEIYDEISSVMLNEFGHGFSFSGREYRISSRSDLHISIGLNATYNISLNDLERLLPKAAANKRMTKRIKLQSFEDFEHNRNNLLSDYRYRMQESMRGVISELIGEIRTFRGELDGIKRSMEDRFLVAEDEYAVILQMYGELIRKISTETYNN